MPKPKQLASRGPHRVCTYATTCTGGPQIVPCSSYAQPLARCRNAQYDPTSSTSFLQERLQAKAEEIAGLKAEVKRLQQSRLLSIDSLAASGDTITITAIELAAMKKDLSVRLRHRAPVRCKCLQGRCSECPCKCPSPAPPAQIGASKHGRLFTCSAPPPVDTQRAATDMRCPAVQDQERLLAAYGDENRAAVKQVKALEARLREKDTEVRAERQRLEAELVRTMEAQQLRTAGTAAKLQYAAALRSALSRAPVAALARFSSLALHALLLRSVSSFTARVAV